MCIHMCIHIQNHELKAYYILFCRVKGKESIKPLN